MLQDVYGNRYTYAHLGKVSKRYPVPKTFDDPRAARDEFRPARQPREQDLPKPDGTRQRRHAGAPGDRSRARHAPTASDSSVGHRHAADRPPPTEKERLFANPTRPATVEVAEETGQLLDEAGFEVFKVYFSKALRLKPSEVKLQDPQEGVEGHRRHRPRPHRQGPEGPGSKLAPHLNFSIRPGRPRRAADRPEADPRRLEAARGDARSTAPRARTRS